MIKEAVQKMVNAIGEEEIKNAVKESVEAKVNTLVTDEVNRVLETGIKGVIEKALTDKLEPVLKAIEQIDVTTVVEKVAEISIGSDVEDLIETLGNTLKEKVKEGIEKAETITVDITQYNGKVNEIIGEQVVEITDDDEDVEAVVKSKVMESVKNIKVGN